MTSKLKNIDQAVMSIGFPTFFLSWSMKISALDLMRG